MKNSNFRMVGLLAVPLVVAASLQVVSLPRFVRADRERNKPSQRACEAAARSAEKESPPEDWFVTQRVTHSGIPIGAPERAGAQAAALAQAAEQSNRPLATAGWRFAGPTNIGGRVVDIAVDPVAADTIYVAAATGGVWKSTDRGARFTSIWPAANPQSMGALVITPNGTLFAGTGEANPGGGSITYGGGGIFRSVNGGVTWQRVGLANSGAIGHLVIDPTNPNRVFASMWDHLREPDLRTYGGVGSGVYRSTDGGSTWQRLTNGLPPPSATIGRIGIAVAPSNPQRVFAIVIQTGGLLQGLYRFDDGGDAWTQLPNSSALSAAQSTYGWWFGRIWVDPSNQNHVFGAGVYLCESTDGGSSFIGQFSPHADDHAMIWDLKVPGRVYLGNDGGTYRSDVNGSHDQWTFAVSQPFTQFYSVDVSEQDTTRVVGGAQDNGVNRSYGGANWNTYIGGDGEEALIDPADQNMVYGCSQYGECSRSTNGGTTSSDFTGATVSSRRNWFSPLQFDLSNSAVLYYAGNQVNRSVDHAVHWSVISPDLTGGPGRDPNYPFGTITTLAAAKMDSNRLFAGTDDGRVWFTTNLGVNWTRVIDPNLPGTWVTRVAADPASSSVAYATFSGFRSGMQLPYVLKTIDGGTTWTSIVGNLPQAPVNDVVVVGSTLYVATDVGVFASDDGGTTWSTAGTKLPNVPVTDLEYIAASNSLYAATFGRGIFSLSLPP